MGISSGITAILASAGVDAATAASIAAVAAPALEGAGAGGVLSGITGGNIGKGALGGAFTGGGIGLGGNLLGGSLGAVGADALGGAAGGALGAEVTGGKPLTGALEGGLSGGLAGALSGGAPAGTPSAGTTGGGVTGAGGAPAPATIDTSAGLPWQDPNYVNPSLGAGQTASAIPNIGGADSNISPSLNNAAQTANAAPSAQSASLNTPNLGTGTTGTQGISQAPSSLPSTAGTGFGSEGSAPSNGLFSNIVSGAKKSLSTNPIGIAASGLGLGLDALKGNQQSSAEKNLEAQASGLASQGQQLEGYLQSGTLPAGLQVSLKQATDSAKATIRSQYASMGLSGSSAEQQALSQVDMQAQAQSAQMAERLLTTGISESEGASQLYETLIKGEAAGDAGLSSAISNFAQAAAGGGGIGGANGFKIVQNTGAGGTWSNA